MPAGDSEVLEYSQVKIRGSVEEFSDLESIRLGLHHFDNACARQKERLSPPG
jgi:hypothetical protein